MSSSVGNFSKLLMRFLMRCARRMLIFYLPGFDADGNHETVNL